MRLGHLWWQQGKRTEAYALLAPVRGWFTEGCDTADLQEAKALLEELGEYTRRAQPSAETFRPRSSHGKALHHVMWKNPRHSSGW